MTGRCGHCPIPPGLACRGQVAPRLCQLTDPGHPDFDTRYGSALAAEAEAAASRPAEYPPVATQAANLAGSLWAWAVSGFSMASDEERARRLAICRACPQYDAEAVRCHLCGCYLGAKTSLKIEHCPINKW